VETHKFQLPENNSVTPHPPINWTTATNKYNFCDYNKYGENYHCYTVCLHSSLPAFCDNFFGECSVKAEKTIIELVMRYPQTIYYQWLIVNSSKGNSVCDRLIRSISVVDMADLWWKSRGKKRKRDTISISKIQCEKVYIKGEETCRI